MRGRGARIRVAGALPSPRRVQRATANIGDGPFGWSAGCSSGGARPSSVGRRPAAPARGQRSARRAMIASRTFGRTGSERVARNTRWAARSGSGPVRRHRRRPRGRSVPRSHAVTPFNRSSNTTQHADDRWWKSERPPCRGAVHGPEKKSDIPRFRGVSHAFSLGSHEPEDRFQLTTVTACPLKD
jgi:hypothetical protein